VTPAVTRCPTGLLHGIPGGIKNAVANSRWTNRRKRTCRGGNAFFVSFRGRVKRNAAILSKMREADGFLEPLSFFRVKASQEGEQRRSDGSARRLACSDPLRNLLVNSSP
jgi:hypothetical protein